VYRAFNLSFSQYHSCRGTFMHLHALYAAKFLLFLKLYKKCPVYCGLRCYGLHIYDLFERYSHYLELHSVNSQGTKCVKTGRYIVCPTHYRTRHSFLDDLPYARPIKSPWIPVSSTRPKCWTCSADVGLPTSPGIAVDMTLKKCRVR
jgi:hypothetical protein